MELFLKDNKFSAAASTNPNVYLKDLSKDVKPVGNLHAHLNIKFKDTTKTSCKVHATIRTNEKAELLGKRALSGKEQSKAVASAIWIYDDGTYRSHVAQSKWIKTGKVTYSDLKSYCRKIVKAIKDWSYEIEKQGVKIEERDPAVPTAMVDMIGSDPK